MCLSSSFFRPQTKSQMSQVYVIKNSSVLGFSTSMCLLLVTILGEHSEVNIVRGNNLKNYLQTWEEKNLAFKMFNHTITTSMIKYIFYICFFSLQTNLRLNFYHHQQYHFDLWSERGHIYKIRFFTPKSLFLSHFLWILGLQIRRLQVYIFDTFLGPIRILWSVFCIPYEVQERFGRFSSTLIISILVPSNTVSW